jgi:hypothetical protein
VRGVPAMSASCLVHEATVDYPAQVGTMSGTSVVGDEGPARRPNPASTNGRKTNTKDRS